MSSSRVRHRHVLVLGRSPVLDVEAVIDRAAVDGTGIVLLSVGYPQTPHQDQIVRRAVERALDERVHLVAELVPSARELGRYLVPGDEPEIVAGRRERGRLARAVGADREGRNREGDATSGIPGRIPAPSRLEGGASPNSEHPEPEQSVEEMFRKQVPSSDIDVVWTRQDAEARKRGRLSIYFGAAPGVGKTYAMLSEAQRAVARGTDVVVGIVETYGRPMTIARLEGLEVIPPRRAEYRGSTFDELDTEAVIDRRPERVLIDEVAHTNVPGSHRAKRWEDVLDVLATGISVIGTLNAQHLASLNDVVARVTGIRQQETVPDWILDLADQVELVDMSPHALQRRMIHGNVYPDQNKADLALRRFFTTENLTALRELALMRVANQVDDDLLRRWRGNVAPETRERILVCVSERPVADELIRRGARIANRSGGDLLVVHAHAGEGRRDLEWHERVGRLVLELGGEFNVIRADDPVDAVLSHAYEQHVTQIIVGESLNSWWQEAFRGSFVTKLIRRAAKVDVHVIARRER